MRHLAVAVCIVGSLTDIISAAQAFFTMEHLSKLEDCLKRSSHSHPQMHSVWKPILSLLMPGHRLFGEPDMNPQSMETSASLEKPLSVFWCKLLVPVLLGSIEERQFLVHRIFQIILPHIPCQHLHIVLGGTVGVADITIGSILVKMTTCFRNLLVCLFVRNSCNLDHET